MNKRTILFLALTAPGFLMSQNPAPAPVESNNMWMYILIAAMAVLLLTTLLLGRVLISLMQLVADKRKKATLTVLLLLLGISLSFSQAPTSAKETNAISSSQMEFMLATVVLVAEIAAILIFITRINSLLNELSDKKREAPAFNFHFPKLFDKFNASVSVEKEHDILLDHNYDGIQELDNNLPPWWKYSFYISIFWAAAYLVYFWMLGGPGQIDEYNRDVAQAKEQQEEFARKNKDRVDENNVKLADINGIMQGKDIFKNNCAACHGNLGEGNVGPNLTDNYWLHGGSITEVFKSVKYGWSAKGMKSWQSDLSASQMRDVASYILSLKGTNPPNAKAPQGDPAPDAPISVTDTVKVASLENK